MCRVHELGKRGRTCRGGGAGPCDEAPCAKLWSGVRPSGALWPRAVGGGCASPRGGRGRRSTLGAAHWRAKRRPRSPGARPPLPPAAPPGLGLALGARVVVTSVQPQTDTRGPQSCRLPPAHPRAQPLTPGCRPQPSRLPHAHGRPPIRLSFLSHAAQRMQKAAKIKKKAVCRARGRRARPFMVGGGGGGRRRAWPPASPPPAGLGDEAARSRERRSVPCSRTFREPVGRTARTRRGVAAHAGVLRRDVRCGHEGDAFSAWAPAGS